jgi:hypothetical protein
MGPHHDSHSPGAINTPLGFAEFLPDLAYVEKIAEIQYCWCARGLLGPRNARSGLLLNGLQNRRLTRHCSPSMHPCGWYWLTPRAWKPSYRGVGHLVDY